MHAVHNVAVGFNYHLGLLLELCTSLLHKVCVSKHHKCNKKQWCTDAYFYIYQCCQFQQLICYNSGGSWNFKMLAIDCNFTHSTLLLTHFKEKEADPFSGILFYCTEYCHTWFQPCLFKPCIYTFYWTSLNIKRLQQTNHIFASITSFLLWVSVYRQNFYRYRYLRN